MFEPEPEKESDTEKKKKKRSADILLESLLNYCHAPAYRQVH